MSTGLEHSFARNRNDALPKIAVTVDLLTTGIDVPSIENLVFIRRVNSRILYEQMLGRATRQCPEIGKESFRIFDAVDLYPHLQNLTEMKPVVVNPDISLEQLFSEFTTLQDDVYRDAVRDQILVKMRRRLRRLHGQARALYETETGEPPEATLRRPRAAAGQGNRRLAEVPAPYRPHPRLGPRRKRRGPHPDLAPPGPGGGRYARLWRRCEARGLP